ncbi:unnamed protein product [Caenorhabditis nigoni]
MATAKSQDFNITSVGYYKRDNEMNVTVDVQPKFANSNYNRLLEFQEPEDYIRENDINLGSPEVPHDGNIENFFESLLNYISIKGFGEKKPLFVTYKQVLSDVAAKFRMQTYIVCHMGMIFISYKKLEKADPEKLEKENSENDETEIKKKVIARREAMGYTAGANFVHYWTKESEDEETPADYATSNYKAVMKCVVRIGGKKEVVLYSTRIDAIEKESGRHVQMKTNRRNNFWTYRNHFWKMFFGHDSMMILGTGSVSEELTDWNLRSIEVLKLEDVFLKMEKIRQEKNELRTQVYKIGPYEKWTLEQGKEHVRRFLSKVKNVCNESEGCFLATETRNHWNFEKVDEEHDAIREFANLVKTKMAVWKINFPNEC